MKTLRPLSPVTALRRLDRIAKKGGSFWLDGRDIIKRGLAGAKKNKKK